MQIIPVIDLKNSLVVHGVAGNRAEYQPVQSRIADSPQPGDVARGFRQRYGFRTAYVADLDALAGHPPDWQSLAEIHAEGLDVWVDAGVADGIAARRMVSHQQYNEIRPHPVVALESLPNLAAVYEVLQVVGVERTIFSLDLRGGQPLTRVPEWTTATPCQLSRMAADAGYRRLLILDLAEVGCSRGVDSLARLCTELRELGWDELIAGGGVRSLEDLRTLKDAGCHAALVATALHQGTLNPNDISTL
jgi:phosphoribosylformimino-5-aminoimidazole carboxamide ribotide isomerase